MHGTGVVSCNTTKRMTIDSMAIGNIHRKFGEVWTCS